MVTYKTASYKKRLPSLNKILCIFNATFIKHHVLAFWTIAPEENCHHSSVASSDFHLILTLMIPDA